MRYLRRRGKNGGQGRGSLWTHVSHVPELAEAKQLCMQEPTLGEATTALEVPVGAIEEAFCARTKPDSSTAAKTGRAVVNIIMSCFNLG